MQKKIQKSQDDLDKAKAEAGQAEAQPTILIVNANTTASIFFDDENSGEFTPHTFEAEEGTVKVTAKAEGYLDASQIAVLQKGKTKTISLFLNKIYPHAPPPPSRYPEIPYYSGNTQTMGYSSKERIHYSPAEIKPYEIQEVKQENTILIDIETTGLQPTESKIFTIGYTLLTNTRPDIIVLIDEDEERLVRHFIQIIDAADITRIIGYNINFDTRLIL